jgi:aspartyl protease family protein
MAIGFMRFPASVWSLHCKSAAALFVLLVATHLPSAEAADISLIGVFAGRGAVLVIDGGAPQSLKIGQRSGTVTLVSVDKSSAVIEEAGQRRTLGIGQHLVTAGQGGSKAAQITLQADGSGHFVSEGAVNGAATRFLVDTGATVVALSGKDARQMGIDFTSGEKAIAMTANGPVPVYRIKLDSVKLGSIELLNVDAMVLDGGGLTQPLLGMSFLNRLEMRRDGDSMTLKRRY